MIPFYFSYYLFHCVIMNKNSRVDMLFTVLHEYKPWRLNVYFNYISAWQDTIRLLGSLLVIVKIVIGFCLQHNIFALCMSWCQQNHPCRTYNKDCKKMLESKECWVVSQSIIKKKLKIKEKNWRLSRQVSGSFLGVLVANTLYFS